MKNNFDLKQYHLTERETEVLGCILEGIPNKEIAKRLFISLDTVKAHVSAILYKMKVSSRIEIIIKVLKNTQE